MQTRQMHEIIHMLYSLLNNSSRFFKGKLFYGWYLCLLFGVIIWIGTSPLFHAMGIWAVAMERSFGWTRFQLSIALSFTRIEGGILGPIEGYLVDKYGVRRMVFIGLFTTGLGWIFFSQVDNLGSFYLAYMLIAFGQGIGGWLALNTLINNWFSKRRSFAIGLANSFGRIGALAIVPLLAWAIDTDVPNRPGWSLTALGLGIFVVAMAYPLTSLIRNKPEEYGLLPDGNVPEDNKNDSSKTSTNPTVDFTVKEALRTKAFWLISLGHGLTAMVLVTFMLHLAPMMIDKSYSLQTASFVVAVYTGVTMAFQMIGGYVGDKMPKNVALMIFSMFLGIAVLVLVFGSSTLTVAYIFAALFGIGFGGRNPLASAIRGDYFGRTNFGKIMGMGALPMNFLMVIGPIYTGYLRDVTGSYFTGFLGLAACAFLGAFLFLFATKPADPIREGIILRR